MLTSSAILILAALVVAVGAINEYPTIGAASPHKFGHLHTRFIVLALTANVPKPSACGNSGTIPAGGWLANKPCGYVMGTAVQRHHGRRSSHTH